MVHELAQEAYGKTTGLWRGLEFNLEIGAILAGLKSGRVVVDDPVRPRAGLLWDKKIMFFVGGDAHRPGFVASLADEIARAAAEVGEGYSRWFRIGYGPGWERVIEEDLRDLSPVKAKRLVYEYRRAKPLRAKLLRAKPLRAKPPEDWRANLPPGFAVVRVDQGLLARTDLTYLPYLLEELQGTWRELALFFRHGFGFAAASHDAVVAWCLSEYNTGRQCGIGVETLREFQRRGLGTAVVAALVEECLARDIRPQWHAAEENLASVALARKAGFEPLRDYTVYRLGTAVRRAGSAATLSKLPGDI